MNDKPIEDKSPVDFESFKHLWDKPIEDTPPIQNLKAAVDVVKAGQKADAIIGDRSLEELSYEELNQLEALLQPVLKRARRLQLVKS